MMNNIPNLSSMVTMEGYSIGANVINHGPYNHQRNAGSSAQKGRNLRGILVSSEVN
jgi:hypothetical protein